MPVQQEALVGGIGRETVQLVDGVGRVEEDGVGEIVLNE